MTGRTIDAFATIAAAWAAHDGGPPLEPTEARFGGMGYGSANHSGGDTTAFVGSLDAEDAVAGEEPRAWQSGMGYGSGN